MQILASFRPFEADSTTGRMCPKGVLAAVSGRTIKIASSALSDCKKRRSLGTSLTRVFFLALLASSTILIVLAGFVSTLENTSST